MTELEQQIQVAKYLAELEDRPEAAYEFFMGDAQQYIQDKLEEGECPLCGGLLKDEWDRVTDDPPYSIHIGIHCTGCQEDF